MANKYALQIEARGFSIKGIVSLYGPSHRKMKLLAVILTVGAVVSAVPLKGRGFATVRAQQYLMSQSLNLSRPRMPYGLRTGVHMTSETLQTYVFPHVQ